MPTWKNAEVSELYALARKGVAFDAICLRIKKSGSAVRSKARREGLELNFATPLPEVSSDGRLLRLGGIEIPDRPLWLNNKRQRSSLGNSNPVNRAVARSK